MAIVEGYVKVVMEIHYELDTEEFNREVGNPEDDEINWGDVQNAIVEQVEEAVKESGNGSSLQLAFGDMATDVRKIQT